MPTECVKLWLTPYQFSHSVRQGQHGDAMYVVAEGEVRVLLRTSNAPCDRLVREAPALAVPFLLALSRAVVQRVRRTNLKYQDSIRFIRASTRPR